MNLSSIITLGNGVYKLKEGFGDRQLCEGDYVKLLFGSISAAPIPQAHNEGDNVSLPSALEEDRLETLYVSNYGSYEDEKGEKHNLFNAALRAVQSMKEGDKFLIVEEEVSESKEETQNELVLGARGQRLTVIQIVEIFKDHYPLDNFTRKAQLPHSHVSDRGRPGVDEFKTNNHQRNTQLQRRPSPVPPALFKTQALCVLFKLWRPRLCPGRMDSEIREVFEEINSELSARDHLLLCIGSWQFQCSLNKPDWETPSNLIETDWALYRFTFHELLEPERDEIFVSMKRCWNNHTGGKTTAEDIARWWRNMNGAISNALKDKLSARQYPCCNCSVPQPHCSKDLDRSIGLLEALDKNKKEERAEQVATVFTYLRVLDMIDQDKKESKHQSVQRCRLAAGCVLDELEDDRRVPAAMQARLRAIVMYEAAERPMTVVLSDLDCLANLEISKKVSA